MAITMITPKTGYMDIDFTRVGLIKSDSGVILIDNGWGRKQGRMILNELEAAGHKLVAIVNTHTHLDHAGANNFLKENTGCETYCTLHEALIIRGDHLLFKRLYEGSMYPLKDNASIYNVYKTPDVANIIEEDTSITIDGVTLDIIGLPGHSEGHIGVAYENIIFCGDAVMGPKAMASSKLVFISNPPKTRYTLEKLRNSNYSVYVPSHGEIFEDPKLTCDLMDHMLDRVEKYILEKIETPEVLDEIIGHVATGFDLHVKDITKFDIVRTVTQSMIYYMVEQERVDYFFETNVMYFKKLAEGETRALGKDKIIKNIQQ